MKVYINYPTIVCLNFKWSGGGKILSTLTGHKGRVNATKWVKKSNCCDETELVSVAADHCGLVWNKIKDSYVVSDILKG